MTNIIKLNSSDELKNVLNGIESKDISNCIRAVDINNYQPKLRITLNDKVYEFYIEHMVNAGYKLDFFVQI